MLELSAVALRGEAALSVRDKMSARSREARGEHRGDVRVSLAGALRRAAGPGGRGVAGGEGRRRRGAGRTGDPGDREDITGLRGHPGTAVVWGSWGGALGAGTGETAGGGVAGGEGRPRPERREWGAGRPRGPRETPGRAAPGRDP